MNNTKKAKIFVGAVLVQMLAYAVGWQIGKIGTKVLLKCAEK